MMFFKILAKLLFLKSLNSIQPDTFCFLDKHQDLLYKDINVEIMFARLMKSRALIWKDGAI